MKKLIITTIVATAIASTAFSQGFVTFSGGGSAATRVSTNSVIGGASTGLISGGANSYYFALFASTAATGAAGSGTNASYVFNNLGTVSSAWELVGIGGSAAAAGRFSGLTQGTASGNQGALNSDLSMTVQGIGGGGSANLIAVGWSSNIGSTLASLMAWYNNGSPATLGWIGQSALTTGATLGDGASIPTPLYSQSSSFVLGAALSPVPEPATLALAALGGASLLLLRRKK
jgi:hypothetical protein